METWVIIAGLIALAIIASASSQQYQIKENFQSVYKNLDKFHDEYSDQLKDVNKAREKYLRELNKLPGQPGFYPSSGPYTSPYVGPDPTVYGPSTYVQPQPTYVPSQPTYVPPQPTYVQPQQGYLPTQTTYLPTPTTVQPVDTTYNQSPVGYYQSNYASLGSIGPGVAKTPILATSTSPSTNDCYHYGQNVCKSQQCHDKQIND